MNDNPPSNLSFLDRPLSTFFKWNVESFLILVMVILALVTRVYQLDQRVMSHDEVNHVVPAYDLYEGKGYRHDPVTHGPFKFHLAALSYFMLGDNDFSSRLPDALFSVATVAFVAIAFRRYLGRAGALVAGLLFLISPFMMFYGRYFRDEAFVVLFEVMILYAILRYMDKGDRLSLFIITIAMVLNFCSEETAFIFTAQVLLFLAMVFITRLYKTDWGVKGDAEKMKHLFLILMAVALIFLLIGLGFGAYNAAAFKVPEGETAVPQMTATPWTVYGLYIALGLAIISGLAAAVLCVNSLGWQGIRSERSFDLLMLIGTLILPLLAPFPITLVKWNPLDYSTEGLIHSGIFLAATVLISIGLGVWWKGKFWITQAVIFYAIFTIFFTTFFTNGIGFFTGLIGSLGYWLSQQGVQRGSQPYYYYAFITIPMYEYLAALGTLLGVIIGITANKFSSLPGLYQSQKDTDSDDEKPAAGSSFNSVPTLGLMVFMAFTALIAYSIAGEKMPWLTVYIVVGMLLAAGWAFGYLIEKVPWSRIVNLRGVSSLLLLMILVTSFGVLVYILLTPSEMPFQGNTLEQLKATNGFILAAIAFIASLAGALYLLSAWFPKEIISLVGVTFLAGLVVLTARAAHMASFINYDTAKEYLVYAHAARGPKDVLAQVEEISKRTTMGKDIVVAHDNDSLYPFWWYFRDYPNKKWFGDKPSNDLKEALIIITGDGTMGKIAPIVKNNYVAFDYMRLWWPNQDYYDLNWDRVSGALSNSKIRAGIFDIWLNRDYTAYAEATNNSTLKLETWQPSSRLRVYIRKDVVAKIWNFGSLPVAQETSVTDPYEGKIITLAPDKAIGLTGSQPSQFEAPRGMSAAPDGTFYVADSRNNRIQHFNAEGELINTWGVAGDISKDAAAAAGGSFNEPWGVAVGPDGSVYVTDTWNHRIQKFNAKGEFVKMWGTFGQGETPTGFWGPRGIVVDSQGRVYVTDTGNKRVVVFNADGDFITQFGSAGVELGQFDEPVGLALDQAGNVYVNDTWNQRIQVFSPSEDKLTYTFSKQWAVNGWFGQSLDNKPFITLDESDHVFITDPEGYRVLEFNTDGTFVRGWGDYSTEQDGFGLTSGICVTKDGKVWVSDGANNRLLRFTMPE